MTLDGVAPAELSRHLAAANVNAPASHFYAIEASRRLGLGDAGARGWAWRHTPMAATSTGW